MLYDNIEFGNHIVHTDLDFHILFIIEEDNMSREDKRGGGAFFGGIIGAAIGSGYAGTNGAIVGFLAGAVIGAIVEEKAAAKIYSQTGNITG